MSTPASSRQRPPLRRRIEAGLGRWALWVARRPHAVIAAVLLLTGLLLPGLGGLEIDTHPERFLQPDHPSRVSYTAFKRQFGLDDGIVVLLHTRDVFDADFLAWLRDVHEALEDRVPHLDEVTSLVNARSTRGEGDVLLVEDLMEDWPATPREIAAIRERAHASPTYRDLLLSSDDRYTSINVLLTAWTTSVGDDAALGGFDEAGPGGAPAPEAGFASGRDTTEAVLAVQAVLDERARPDVEVFMAGNPVMNVRLSKDMGENLTVFVSLSLVAVVIVLALLFRRASGVLLPVSIIVLTVLITFCVAGLSGRPLNVTVQILPTFLLAVSASAAIHVLVIFYQRFDAGAPASEATAAALGHSGLAIIMAGLTTAGGLMSFNAAGIEPVRDLGRFAPVGILIGLLLCLVLLPALLCALPLRRRPPRTHAGPGQISRWLLRAGDFAVSHPVGVVAATLAICALAGLGVAQLQYQHDPMSWFPEDDPMRVSTRVADEHMGGATSVEVVIDTGRDNGLHEPAFMRALAGFHESVPTIPIDEGGVRKTLSLADILREIHQALNENRREFYTIPDDRQLIAQELLLFENSGSDDMEDFVDSRFSKTRFTARMRWAPGTAYEAFLFEIQSLADATFPGARVEVTGLTPLIVTAVEEVRWGMIRSYVLALLIITPLMMILIGTLRGGLASMLPNLAPIFCVMGFMGLLGIPLDIFTMLIGSIAIGLAVDDTIHFMHVFYRRFGETGDTRTAVRDTLATTGNALLTTSIVLSSGFMVFAFASMQNLVLLGVLTSMAIILAFLADVIVAPALVTLATRGKSVAPATGEEEVLHEAS